MLKYFLWLCLSVLLGAFLFGLIKFKGNFVEYIQYLDNIEIREILNLKLDTEKESSQDEMSDEEIFDDALLKEESDYSDDYFLPEADNLDMEDSAFGFSGSLETTETFDSQQNAEPSVSKEDLINLIKSSEK